MTKLLTFLIVALGAAAAATARQPCQAEWRPLGKGLPDTDYFTSMAVYDDGTGPALYVGGGFTIKQGAPANGVARWDGIAWCSVGGGGIEGGHYVSGFLVYDDGAGPALYMVGDFTKVAGVPADRAARWDGHAWSQAGSGLTDIHLHPEVLAVYDDGRGPRLYAGGWGGGDSMVAMLVQDQWAPVGKIGGFADRFSCAFVPTVWQLQVFDDGSGPQLYAAGHFYYDTPDLYVYSIARWNGQKWSDVGGLGTPDLTCIYATAVFDDGAGPALYVGGWNGRASRWNGTSWSDVPGLAYQDIWAMETYDDGHGPALYVGGTFAQIEGQALNSIARWDGKSWSGFDGGATRDGQPGNVYALCPGWDDLSTLFVSGDFNLAGGKPAANIARWGCEAQPPCPADCNADGDLDVEDWLCFSAKFNAADPAADCDGSGSLDLFDFLCFTNAFNAGC